MLFCENCHLATEETRCPECNSKNLRQVTDEDFCFLIEKRSPAAERIVDVLKENGIECVAMPFRSGLEAHLAMPLTYFRLFVKFAELKKAGDIIYQLEKPEIEMLRQHLLSGVNELNVLQKTEKKIRKKLKLPTNVDFFDYCINIIKTAPRIAEQGYVASAAGSGKYVCCYSGGLILAVNSKTFEIIFLVKSSE